MFWVTELSHNSQGCHLICVVCLPSGRQWRAVTTGVQGLRHPTGALDRVTAQHVLLSGVHLGYKLNVRILSTSLATVFGEGNGTPLQYSCLENPMDGGACRLLQSMGSMRVGHDRATSLSLLTFMHCRRKWQPTAVLLPAESQRRRSLVGCRLWGGTESDTTQAS